MMMTLRDAARRALAVQDSVDLPTIAEEYCAAVRFLKDAGEPATHPIVQLYLDRMGTLADMRSSLGIDALHIWTRAWGEVRAMAKVEE